MAARDAGSGAHSASRSKRTASFGFSFSVLIGAGQLNPGLAFIDELADRLEAGIVERVGLCETAEVIEHDRRGNAPQQIFDAGDLLALHVDLNMPAEIVHALRQRLDHLDRRGARLDQVEADAANAEIVHALE